MPERILGYISTLLALFVVLPVHEFAHGFVAVKCGDPTPRLYGRYTLNPLAHFDLTGLICFVLVGFGWAKPVPINPNNFRNFKRGCFLTSIAGVVSNYITAFIAFPLYILTLLYVPEFGYFTEVLTDTLLKITLLSLSFMIFNLLPIYPLDGFRVIDSFTKKRGKIYWFLRSKGHFILLGLIFLGFIADITGNYNIDILGNLIKELRNILIVPINAFWGLIF